MHRQLYSGPAASPALLGWLLHNQRAPVVEGAGGAGANAQRRGRPQRACQVALCLHGGIRSMWTLVDCASLIRKLDSVHSACHSFLGRAAIDTVLLLGVALECRQHRPCWAQHSVRTPECRMAGAAPAVARCTLAGGLRCCGHAQGLDRPGGHKKGLGWRIPHPPHGVGRRQPLGQPRGDGAGQRAPRAVAVARPVWTEKHCSSIQVTSFAMSGKRCCVPLCVLVRPTRSNYASEC